MQSLATFAFVLIAIAAMTNLIFRDWRVNSAAMVLQYLAAFILVSLSWPVSLAIVNLITGWMSTSALGLTRLRQKNAAFITESNTSLVFRGLSGLLTVMLIFILAPILQQQVFPKVDLLIIQGGLILSGISLLQLGTNSDPYMTIISLLSFLTGFSIIHSALEVSTLLLGLMVVVNLGLALVGVYFIVKTAEAEETSIDEGSK